MINSPSILSPLRIAIGHADLPNESKGGVAHQSHHLANALVLRGHQVTMVTFSPPCDDSLYAVRTLPKPRLPHFVASFAFAFALRKQSWDGFDIVHLMGDNYLTGGGGHPPIVRTINGSARDEMRSASTLRRKIFQAVLIPLEEWGARRADYVTGISEATRLRFPEVAEVIPCGVDLSSFASGTKEDSPIVLFVGTKGGRKRGQWLADQWSREMLPRLPSGATLWAVSDEPLEGDGIKNFGRIPFKLLTELYKRAWVFCLPSLYEGFGVPYIEAFASGTVAVGSPNMGAREVLADGKYGVVAPDDTLARELISLLTDPARRGGYESLGSARAREYGWEAVVARYEKVYGDLLDRNVVRDELAAGFGKKGALPANVRPSWQSNASSHGPTLPAKEPAKSLTADHPSG